MKILSCLLLFICADPGLSRAQTDSGTFTSIELQQTAAYLNYRGKECRMLRLLFHGGRFIGEGVLSMDFNGISDSITIPANDTGISYYEIPLPGKPVEKPVQAEVRLTSMGQIYSARCIVTPARKWTVYVLPHSHVDIGYTNVQDKVLQLHMNNIDEAIALGRRTADYPPEARYKWNTEAIWVVENYLQRCSEQKRAAFWDAVKKGWINLDAAYGNINTSATDARQLLQMFYKGVSLAKEEGIEMSTLFQGDVPGASWGLAAQSAQTGIKYFLSGPNASDRIGHLPKWQDKPFYWISPSGKEKLLFWQCQPYSIGYALKGRKIPNFFTVEDPKPFYTGNPSAYFLNPHLFGYLQELETGSFPYDMTILTWAMSDNAPIDPELPDAVREWNKKFASPKLVITSTKQFFSDFEKRYGSELPAFKGDYTEYWTDGLGSAARETARNRAAADRLRDADILWVMNKKGSYPFAAFEAAWRNVLLFSEHTWGAYNSVSAPDDPKVKEQWRIKKGYTIEAEQQSSRLLQQALHAEKALLQSVDVFNTESWTRTDLVIVPAALSTKGDLVKDDLGTAVESQRLTSGELAFIASAVPAFGKKTFTIQAGNAFSTAPGAVSANALSNGLYELELDSSTGNIRQLKKGSITLVNRDSAGLNQYYYLPGDSLKNLQTSGHPTIIIKEKGPLVTSVVVSSEAPGTGGLTREIRLVKGLDKVEIINTVDKTAIRRKEGIHFAFPFSVPGGQVRYHIPWGSVTAESDQLPNANKNWYLMQRWIDISNADYGITLSSPDAPLFEIGKITARLLGGQYNSPAWVKFTDQSPTLYSWVMNNHWHTNFPAEQEGKVRFRYSLRAHSGPFDVYAAQQAGLENHHPLLVARANRRAAGIGIEFKAEGVIVEGLKPANDGKGMILQLLNTNIADTDVSLTSKSGKRLTVFKSDLLESKAAELNSKFTIPGKGMTIIRVEQQ